MGKLHRQISPENESSKSLTKKYRIPRRKSKIIVSTLKDSIKFKDIHFQYPETNSEVLHGINLEIKIGDTIAFVGSSGSGKSTLMDLIPRFYDLSVGEITFDGTNIQDYSLHDLRRKIGIVTQNIFLFHGTVAENIAYGRPNLI